MNSELCNTIFRQVITRYHVLDQVDQPLVNPFPGQSIEHLLYTKCWIDTVQWHLEDMIRDPQIDPIEALQLKRRIDRSNQERTDMVEFIDSWLLQKYSQVTIHEGAVFNTESPAWAIDRLSILALKVYHMEKEAFRVEATVEHREACRKKLAVLLQQQVDLSFAIDQLINDISEGRKYMKVYKQMKMYNDEALNPVLYQLKK